MLRKLPIGSRFHPEFLRGVLGVALLDATNAWAMWDPSWTPPPWVFFWLFANAAMPFVAAVVAAARNGSALLNFFAFLFVAILCAVTGLGSLRDPPMMFVITGLGYAFIALSAIGTSDPDEMFKSAKPDSAGTSAAQEEKDPGNP